MTERKRTAIPPRRYSLNEIDRMREAISTIKPPSHTYYYDSGRLGSYGHVHTRTVDDTEDLLRTYIIGGVSADELEAKAEAVIAARIHEVRVKSARDAQRRSNANLRRLFGYDK